MTILLDKQVLGYHVRIASDKWKSSCGRRDKCKWQIANAGGVESLISLHWSGRKAANATLIRGGWINVG